jgi:hypothetical protein
VRRFGTHGRGAAGAASLLVGLALVGCGTGAARSPAPADPATFPHQAGHPLFQLGWTWRVLNAEVEVVGVLEVINVGDVVMVILEIHGLDAEGSPVARRLVRVEPLRPLHHRTRHPFEVRFPEAEGATRYTVDVWTYHIGRDGNGRGGAR